MNKLIAIAAFFVMSLSAGIAQDFTEKQLEGGISTFHSEDFNNDGKPDLLGIKNIDDGPVELILMMNTTADTISFEEILLASSPLFSGEPAVGDFDADGDLDIAVAFSEAKNIVLLRNNGGNAFLQEDLGVSGVNILRFQDLESDGDMDIIGYTFDDTDVISFINDGTGVLSTSKFFEHQNDISFVDYGDIDDDGDVDVVLSVDKFSGETVAIYLNDSLNNYEKFTSADINALNSAIQVQMIDWNQDGRMDIVGLNDKKFTAFIQSEVFGFVPLDLIEPDNIGDFSRFTIADYDANGAWDVVIGDFTDELRWYENKGLIFTQRPISAKQDINNLISDDYDGDGDADFIAYNKDISIFTNEVEQMPSSLAEINAEKLVISPNPVQDYLSISSESAGLVYIYDMSGKLVIEAIVAAGTSRISVSGLDNGMYQLRNIDLKSKTLRSTKIIKI